MTRSISRWMPMALCCLPGVIATILIGAVNAIRGESVSAFFGGPLAVGLTLLALLVCPFTMGLMMKQGSKRPEPTSKSAVLADCCTPGEQLSTREVDHLTALCKQREALEREVADLQAR